MRKTIQQDSNSPVIVNENGKTTTTSPFYVRELRTYTPLPNGFNLELANHILGVIEDNKLLWDQGNWRRVFFVEENHLAMDGAVDEEFVSECQHDALAAEGINTYEITTSEWLDSLKGALAYQQDATDPICGTAMCFAGWINEMVGADWMIDTKTALALKKTDGENEIGRFAEKIVVPATEAEKYDFVESWLDGTGGGYWLTDRLLGLLKARGYSSETHKLVEASSYAKAQLGLESDWLEMFAASNTFETVKRCVAAYAEHGPQPSAAGAFAAYPEKLPYDVAIALTQEQKAELVTLLRKQGKSVSDYCWEFVDEDEDATF